MRRLLLGAFFCACTAVVADSVAPTNGVRNPFWPVGYEGLRETISPDMRKRPKLAPKNQQPPRPVISAIEKERLAAERAVAEKAAKEAAAKAAAEKAAKEAAARAEAERKKREVTDAHWAAARAALSFGGRMKFREEDELQNTSVVINGKVYSNGDLVSVTHDSRRFTWRYEGLTDQNKLRLAQVRAKYLEKPGEAGKKSDKGANP